MNGGDTIVPLSLRLRGIEFSLVSDKAESNLAYMYLYCRTLLSPTKTKLNSILLSLRLS
jgi:hypothetical protein